MIIPKYLSLVPKDENDINYNENTNLCAREDEVFTITTNPMMVLL